MKTHIFIFIILYKYIIKFIILINSSYISHVQIVAQDESPLTREGHDGACPVTVCETLVFFKSLVDYNLVFFP